MKRYILAVLLVVCFCFGIYGQNSTPIDLVLVLDTSTGMSSSYENVNDYITGEFLTEFLRLGDTFHLVPFSENPRLDVARRVAGVGDVETIIGRMLLQYPVEIGSNPAAAINYAEQYVTSLPSRPKKIVLISTGSSGLNEVVNAANQRLSSSNTTLDYVQVVPGQPLSNLPRSGRPSAVASGPSTSQQTVTQPQTSEPVVTPPPSTGQTQTVYTPPVTHEEPQSGPMISMPLLIGLILLLLLVLGLILFLVSRRLGKSPGSTMADVSSSDADRLEKFAAGQSKQRSNPYADRYGSGKSVTINPTGPLLLNCFVEDQNTLIGKRNIHNLKSGYSLSVGGGGSDFLIFLVNVPSNLGELRRNGSQLTFIPKKPKYFPDLGSSELRDCLNKTIRIISDRNYEMRFRFEMYEDPLESLNRVLNSIKVPG